MNRIFTLIAVTLFSVSLFAGGIKIGNLYYNLDGGNKTAVVTFKAYSSTNYNGLTTVTIPDSVLYEGNYYAVTAIGNNAFKHCSTLQSVTIGDNVQAIWEAAFENCSSLQSVTIGSGVQTIGQCAFFDCSSLQLITIPDNVQTIEELAFYGCKELQSVTIGSGVLTIGKYAFTECEKLQSVIIPNNVQTIEEGAFYRCKELQSVTIGSGVLTIGKYAFAECEKLQSVIIPDNVQTIEEGAFGNCASLQSVTFGENVQTIGHDVFNSCPAFASFGVATNNQNFCSVDGVLFSKDTLTLIQYPSGNMRTAYTIPNNVQVIGNDAFKHCSFLQSVTIGENVRIIENWAIDGCSSLQSITIPDNVQTIGEYAFNYCTSLQSVTIGSGVQTISEAAFTGCSALATIINLAATPQSINANVFDGVDKSACTLYVPAASLEAYQTADVWKDFGNNIQAKPAVSGRYKIGDLYYYLDGDNMTAEVMCEKLANETNYAGLIAATIPDSVLYYGFFYAVTAIGEVAFYNCHSLQSVTIGDNVQIIGESAFSNCDVLQSVTIGKNVQSIWNSAFSGCIALATIINRATTPQSINANVFDGVDKSACTLYVPAASLEAYQTADVWKDFGNNIQAKPAVSGRYKIGDLYYNLNGENLTAEVTYETDNGNNYAGLIAATIPDSVKYKGYYYAVTAIGEDALRDCDMLQSVTISNGVKTIEQRAFYYCTSLYSISIKGKVRTIGLCAFYNCSSLQSVTIGDNVQTIEKGAFYNCTSLRSVTIGNGVQTIGEYAFYNCYSMHSVAIGSGVQTIGRYAFTECEKLQSVIIPDNVQTIEEGAFGNCASLQSVTIGSGVQTIGNHAFVFCGNLATIINRAATPQTIDESVFYNVNKDACSLYVPTESLTGYQNADVWKEFFSIRSIGSQGIHDVQSDNVQSTKVIRNGQAYIMCNGQMYNMQGQEVK
ncbi:MAG: leucine-rich repeat domain-containing protein [Paludibacteraceae bacterium]|nr:leucine-rich repeat domain-containing protein [Paludibacteraceae bacterium]